MNAEFIKKDKGEFILGIPSSEIVWKRYVLTKVSLNENALIDGKETVKGVFRLKEREL
jgi:hypothetical protein